MKYKNIVSGASMTRDGQEYIVLISEDLDCLEIFKKNKDTLSKVEFVDDEVTIEIEKKFHEFMLAKMLEERGIETCDGDCDNCSVEHGEEKAN